MQLIANDVFLVSYEIQVSVVGEPFPQDCQALRQTSTPQGKPFLRSYFASAVLILLQSGTCVLLYRNTGSPWST
jgi:hypothetical protein